MIKLVDDTLLFSGTLGLRLNDNGKWEQAEGYYFNRKPIDVLFDLIEYQLCNGWESISAHDLGYRGTRNYEGILTVQDDLVLHNGGITVGDDGYITHIDHFYYVLKPYAAMVQDLLRGFGMLMLQRTINPFGWGVYSHSKNPNGMGKLWKRGYPEKETE